jgi:pimeloyl-ACP methyl ester carboxylesterase
MRQRWIFPIFNGLVCALMGGLVGYYTFAIPAGVLIGGSAGLLVSLPLEWGLGRLGLKHWLYQRRVLLTVLVELPFVVFIAGPYAFVIADTRPDSHPVCCETPLDYGVQSYENVRIQVGDGVALAGWYVPPQQTPGAVIVVLHGSRSDRRDGAWHARQLIQAGYGVLMYDQRALGESSGRTVSYGWLDASDLLSAVDYLESRPEVDPERIGAVGLSLGGYIALDAAYQEPDRFAALWLDGLHAQRMEDFPEPQNGGEKFAILINAMIFKMMEFRLGREAPPAFTQILSEMNQPPITIVAGGLNDFEKRVNQKYTQVIQPTTRIWMIENAQHVGGPGIVPDEYRQRMLDFFRGAFEK